MVIIPQGKKHKKKKKKMYESGFADEIKNCSIECNHILLSYDACMSALFTNVSLKETIDILADYKAFKGNWFDKTYSMQLQHQLTELLEIATTNELFQFNGELYEHTDDIAI